MIDRILLPLDGSPEAEAALPTAVGLARAFRAEVILLRVVERSLPGDWADPLDWRVARIAALQYLDHVKERFRGVVPSVDLDVGTGLPAEEILESARARRVDLVVMTSHGRGGPSEFPLAATAHKVASAADISLLVVPAGERAAVGLAGPILVPLDGSQRAEWALGLAVPLARSQKSELVALHVIREPEVLQVEGAERVRRLSREYVEASVSTAQRYLDTTVGRLRGCDLRFRTRVGSGTSVPRAIEQVAGEERVSLVVLSAHGRTASERCPFGTVAGGVLSAARYPVLVLQDRPAPRPEVWSPYRGAVGHPRVSGPAPQA